MNWTAESFHKDSKGKSTTWITNPGGMQVIVTRHIHFPDTWVLLCRDLGFDMIDLHADDADSAKVNALDRVKRTIEERVEKLQSVLEVLDEQPSN
jgi:thiosulfate reductase cytochrome b subunit